MVFLISFTSADAENVEYFNRFDMYYEESPVTNLLFPSGYVVYATHRLYDPYNPDDFHNLEYFYDNDPSVLEEAAKLCAENTSVFKFGVVGGASTVSDLNVNIM